MLTIKELIEKLSQFSPETEVWLGVYSGLAVPVDVREDIHPESTRGGPEKCVVIEAEY